MTNHVPLLATSQVPDGLPRMMQALGRRYVRYFKHACRRSGTLWEGRFRSCRVDAYACLQTCQRGIELDPLRAGMVSHPAECVAVPAIARPRLWRPHELYLRLGGRPEERQSASRELFRASLGDADIANIRAAAHKGLALGNRRFRTEIGQLAGRGQATGRPGPKPKPKPKPKGERGGYGEASFY